MRKPILLLSILIFAALLISCPGTSATPTKPPEKVESTSISKPVSNDFPEDCPVTLPDKILFEAPEPFSSTPPWPNFFWYGSEHLWTVLPTEGSWSHLPLNPEGYTQKILWWSDLFSLKDEPEPALVVTGKRLDEEAPPLKTYGATNAFADDIGEAMLTGVDFPTHGCWEVTGQYKKAELSFVVWIAK